MKLHRITLALCYYLGLYPFRYDNDDGPHTAARPFHLTTLGILFKSSNVTFLLGQLVYRMINFFVEFGFQMRINQVPDHKWIDLLPYWSWIRYFLAVYCLIWMTTGERIRFLNNSFAPFTSVQHTAYFAQLVVLTLIVYLWFNATFTSLTGTTCYLETFAGLHSDLIFVAFESLILFVLNSARRTLNDIERRLKSIQTRAASRSQISAYLTLKDRARISSARMLHFDCASTVENLINEYKFLLLFVMVDNYIIMVSNSYLVTLLVYLQLWRKESKNLALVGSVTLCIITKIIRLWTLCEADNLINEQVRIYQYQCSMNPIKLTVAGLFNLDMNFLQSFLAAAVAYVVLMLQLSHVDVVVRDSSLTTFLYDDENITTTTSVSLSELF